MTTRTIRYVGHGRRTIPALGITVTCDEAFEAPPAVAERLTKQRSFEDVRPSRRRQQPPDDATPPPDPNAAEPPAGEAGDAPQEDAQP